MPPPPADARVHAAGSQGRRLVMANTSTVAAALSAVVDRGKLGGERHNDVFDGPGLFFLL
jgi:hypothetical protein